MSEKPKFHIGDDGEIEPDQWEDLKPKRDAPLHRRLLRGPWVPFILLLQTFCLGALCFFVALVITGVINQDRLKCLFTEQCSTDEFYTRDDGILTTLIATTTTVHDCDDQFLARTDAQALYISEIEYRFGAVYLLDPKRGDSCRFLTNSEGVYSFSWSPNGSQVAFTSSRGLWLADAEGKNQQFINGDLLPDDAVDWSPDGTKIVFSNKQSQLWILDTASRLTTAINTDLTIRYPRWSPDGKYIAVMAGKDNASEIYVLDADGTNPRRLTNNTTPDEYPTWLGQRIVFVSGRDGNPEIYTMELDGSNQRQLTDNNFRDAMPAVSAKTGQILFVSYAVGDNNIYIMESDGSNLRPLTDNRANNTMPTWKR